MVSSESAQIKATNPRLLAAVHAFANLHTTELTLEARTGFISGAFPRLECFGAIVDTPRADDIRAPLLVGTPLTHVPRCSDGHVAYTGFVEHLARMHARGLGGAPIGLQALALLCAGGIGHGSWRRADS
jgi:hypothetical protein